MHALVKTESSWKPYAIGPDSGGTYIQQPKSLDEAVRTAKELKSAGRKFSVGLAQIHISNIESRGLTWEQAFNPCQNLALGQKILWDNFKRAQREGYQGIDAVWAALRGYNSGGVHRPISDKYAQKIFTYMQTGAQTPSAIPVRQTRTTPASSNPQFAQMAPVIQTKNVSVQVGQLDASSGPTLEPEPTEQKKDANALRKGESPEIFQREEEKQGF